MIKSLDSASPEKRALPVLLLLASGSVLAVFLLACLAGEQLVGLEMDDPWYMWFAWRFAHGQLNDPLFGASGTQLFGRIWVWLLSKVYGIGAWRPAAAHIMSLSFIALAAAIWLRLGRQLGFRRDQAVFLAAMLIVYYPFFRAGLSSRPEAFIWFLATAALLALDEHQPFVAGILAGVAAETHPMGLVALVYLSGWLWRMLPEWGSRRVTRSALWIAAGLGAAFLGYLAWHGDYLLAILRGHATSGFAALVSFRTPVLAYLDSGDSFRRAGAALLIAVGFLAYFFAGTYRREKFPLYLLLFLCVLFLVVPRANGLYFIYFAPIPLLALTASIPNFRVTQTVLLLIILPCLVIYGTAAYLNRGYSEASLEQSIHATLPGSDEPVLTTSIFWPALRCQANMISIQEFPQRIRDGNAFYVLLQTGQNLKLDFPSDTTVRHIHLSPKVDFSVYHVRPRQPATPTSNSYQDCPSARPFR